MERKESFASLALAFGQKLRLADFLFYGGTVDLLMEQGSGGRAIKFS